MSKKKKEVVLNAVKAEIISPKRYVSLPESELSNITSTTIIPPQLGSKSIGSIHVTYDKPVYKKSSYSSQRSKVK